MALWATDTFYLSPLEAFGLHNERASSSSFDVADRTLSRCLLIRKVFLSNALAVQLKSLSLFLSLH